MSERTAFEKFLLFCVALGSSFLLLGVGILVGDHMARTKLEQDATMHCGAKFDQLTGEFSWVECPLPEPEVVAPEPEEPVAPTETVPPVATETPSEPVH